jgi:hypothetical protein
MEYLLWMLYHWIAEIYECRDEVIIIDSLIQHRDDLFCQYKIFVSVEY